VLYYGTYVVVDAAAVEGLHASLGRTRVIVLDESVVEALCLFVSWVQTVTGAVMGQGWKWLGLGERHKQAQLTVGELAVLSGMILTLCTWPVVSKI